MSKTYYEAEVWPSGRWRVDRFTGQLGAEVATGSAGTAEEAELEARQEVERDKFRRRQEAAQRPKTFRVKG